MHTGRVGLRRSSAAGALSSWAESTLRGAPSSGMETPWIHGLAAGAGTRSRIRTALGEAMACGCVPVGPRVAGTPDLIGDTGVSVPQRDPDATAAGIREAYESDLGGAARRRIEERFSRERRKLALIDTVQGLVNQNAGKD